MRRKRRINIMRILRKRRDSRRLRRRIKIIRRMRRRKKRKRAGPRMENATEIERPSEKFWNAVLIQACYSITGISRITTNM